MSSEIANDPAFPNAGYTAVGYSEASFWNITSFFGESVDSTTLLIRYTLGGDANLNGTVENITVESPLGGPYWNQTGQYWMTGDYNYDGSVNSQDFGWWAVNYGLSL